ncbi:capsule biosynthesis protein [Caulobacter sp. KR2-114]|uniref:capsule biosynthesis protein n=1 Tax=Caulobacter sp. KR2-114 TaxID=3400912 RepID=UPI003C0C4B33
MAPQGQHPCRHFLFVTAPFGPFSRLLASDLRRAGARCTRVLLNGGDLADWGLRHAALYRERPERWPAWIADLLAREAVTDLLVFGDTHPYCVAAIREAQRQGLAVHVLEEGYFRPHWITLERDGVNGNSRLPRDPQAYGHPALDDSGAPAAPMKAGAASLAARMSWYFVALYLCWPLFPHFRAPYAYSPPRQAAAHVARFLSRVAGRRRPARDGGLAPGYFLALLQRPGDSQIVRHSPFKSVRQMIERSMASFADHAPPDARLVFKAHPLDHGIEPHHSVIAAAARRHGVEDRVAFVEHGDLEAMLDEAVGVVAVNSTAGIAALSRGRATVVLGSAIYNLPGLTHQSGLDAFWSRPEAPDMALFERFRRGVIDRTQVNGAYASRAGARLAARGVSVRLLSQNA